MTLGFSTHWPKDMPDHLAGELTLFPDKILESLKGVVDFYYYDYACGELPIGFNSNIDDIPDIEEITPKIHTIRFLTERQAELWSRPKRVIHFVINNRTKNRYQFAPVVFVKGVQKIKIEHSKSNPPIVRVNIDGFTYWTGNPFDRYMSGSYPMVALANNDGFEQVEDFFAYFTQEAIAWQSALGKEPYIIHWTDLKY
ncbi:hypothetical protein L0P88_04155 [Muricauda sp. SCSIO 64092]|uniref:hypothetical protein n=1 Tax=Allomuricauda sp. SCSIO 64092 TaxID=2908842 RepID=UPI001FF0EE05|nr:hypothetical protein [Muricauda sp. SCSIO 64092]UOY07748.1 hypothetical protein L0P88_04155 [Muricauda sp. SCSIO 64092]